MVSIAGAVIILVGLGAYAYGVQKKAAFNKPIEHPEPTTVSFSRVAYTPGVQGYLAEPTAAAPDGVYPGVVMIHEWWGLNEHIERSARLLAAEGYRVLAVDLYNGKVATTPDEARTYKDELDQTVATANLRAATAFLRTSGSKKIGAWGWCFGGGQSVQLSLSGERLNATVVYYGQLETNAITLRKISWPVLGVFGEKDTTIPLSAVQAFRQGLTANNTPNEIYIYSGVGHAFANPSGDNFAPKETEDAWKKTLKFLQLYLKS